MLSEKKVNILFIWKTVKAQINSISESIFVLFDYTFLLGHLFLILGGGILEQEPWQP